MDLLYTAAIAWSQLLTFRYDIICGKSKKLYPISLDFKEDEFYCKQSSKISQNSPESIPLQASPEGSVRHKVYLSCVVSL